MQGLQTQQKQPRVTHHQSRDHGAAPLLLSLPSLSPLSPTLSHPRNPAGSLPSHSLPTSRFPFCLFALCFFAFAHFPPTRLSPRLLPHFLLPLRPPSSPACSSLSAVSPLAVPLSFVQMYQRHPSLRHPTHSNNCALAIRHSEWIANRQLASAGNRASSSNSRAFRSVEACNAVWRSVN